MWVILWFVFLLPKLLYGLLVRCFAREVMALWRLCSRETVAVCPHCRRATVRG